MYKILFIGGAGFIGSNLIKYFVRDTNFKIFVYEPELANISRLDDYSEQLTLIRGSIEDFDLLKCVVSDHRIDTIVHLVSTMVPGSSYDDYKREIETIVFPTVQLMGLCSERNIKFIYFSSGGTIYGNSANGYFTESDVPAPISYYGLSKQLLENSILFENRNSALRYLIVRPSNPYGKGQALSGSQGFVAVAIGKLLSKEPVDVWGDGTSMRDYIFIDDLADCFYQLVIRNVENDTVNIGSGYGYSVNDIIDRIREIAEESFDVRYIGKRSVDVNSMVLNIDKLSNYVNVCHTPLKDGIEIFYQYAKSTKK